MTLTTQKKTKVIITRLCTGEPGIKSFPLIDIEIMNFLISGYGDSYDEEDDDQYEMDSLEDATTTEDGTKDDNNIYKDMTRTRFVESNNEIPTQEITLSFSARRDPSRVLPTRAFPSSRSPTSPIKIEQKLPQRILCPTSSPSTEKTRKIPS